MLTTPSAALGAPTVRALWRTPVFGVAALAAAPSIYASARGENDLSFVVALAAIVGAACVGFAVDDPAENTLASCPIPRATRRLVRAGVILAAVAVSWSAVALSARMAGFSMGPLRMRIPEVAAAAAVSLAFGARAVRSGSDSPGLAAATATVLAMSVSSGLALYFTWLPQVGHPLHAVRWWMVAAVASTAAWWWSRDPAARTTLSRSTIDQ